MSSLISEDVLPTSEPWLPLLQRLTASVPESFVWKNADPALDGIGDIDYCAPRRTWQTIHHEFGEWAAASHLGPVIRCPHIPYGMVLVTAADGGHALYELDVRDRVTVRGGTLFRADDVKPFLETDPRGFRKLRPGAEGIVKLVLYGMRRGGRRRPEGLAKERVALLLAKDPEGARAAARLFGAAQRAAIKGGEKAATGDWDRRAMSIVNARTNARALINPVGVARRVRYGYDRKRCPVMRAIIEHHRRIPGDRSEWLREVARTHDVKEGGFVESV
jgi:hypothetical protein